jgi:ferredoxin-NADP reductase
MPGPEILRVRPYIVREIKWESVDVYTLRLEPAPGEPMISFLPGQWVYLHLLNPDGSSWGRAAFSIASAPNESKEMIELAIKIEKDFTKRGGHLQPGDKVGIQGPFGVFVLPQNVTPLVMFAGGIGISPLRSMLREAYLRQLPVDITLFYSNRYVEDAVYLEELEDLGNTWPNFHPIFTLTGDDNPSIWKGELGRCDAAMLRRHLSDFTKGEFLMCGPDAFMDQVKVILEGEGVDVKKRLKKELFG